MALLKTLLKASQGIVFIHKCVYLVPFPNQGNPHKGRPAVNLWIRPYPNPLPSFCSGPPMTNSNHPADTEVLEVF